MSKCEYQIKTNAGMVNSSDAEEIVTGGNHLIRITNEDH